MAFIPYEQITMETRHPPAEVAAKLAEHVEPRRWFRNPFRGEYKPFEGTVGEDGFKINRILDNRRSLKPQITGRFEASRSGTRIIITIKLRPAAVVFMIIWSSLLGFASIKSIVHFDASGDLKQQLIFVLMFLISYPLFLFSFKREVKILRRHLRDILLRRYIPWRNSKRQSPKL